MPSTSTITTKETSSGKTRKSKVAENQLCNHATGRAPWNTIKPKTSYTSENCWATKAFRIRSCIDLEKAIFGSPRDEEFTVRVADTLEEACELVEAGFEYITDMESVKILRKRKYSITLA